MHIKNSDVLYQTLIKKIRETYNSNDEFRESSLAYILETFFFLLYSTVLVLPYIDMNPPWVYMSS